MRISFTISFKKFHRLRILKMLTDRRVESTVICTEVQKKIQSYKGIPRAFSEYTHSLTRSLIHKHHVLIMMMVIMVVIMMMMMNEWVSD